MSSYAVKVFNITAVNQIYLDALKDLSVHIIYPNERIGKRTHFNVVNEE